ncbi:MAG: hypothetical protein EB003_05365 [Flavobacteriia bacterium]|nr:hypothetical protein [Flavobacteriia bacterium]
MELIFIVISFLLVCLAMVAIVYLFVKRQHDQSLVALQTELSLQRQNYFLPSKLEAYQRCILLLDRIAPANLTLRTLQVSNNARMQQSLLVKTVREEFEHNIAQQLFVSPQAWLMLVHAKEEVLRVINLAANNLGEQASATDLAAKILEISAQIEQFPTEICRSYLQNEFQRFNA